jgi:hypothetical protein
MAKGRYFVRAADVPCRGYFTWCDTHVSVDPNLWLLNQKNFKGIKCGVIELESTIDKITLTKVPCIDSLNFYICEEPPLNITMKVQNNLINVLYNDI